MFLETIALLNKRGSVQELDDKMAEAIRSVRTTGKAAEIIYKVKIKPQDAEGETVQIEDSITIKTANPLRKPALFFTTEDGRVTRDDPNQPEFLKSLPGGKGEQPIEAEFRTAAGQ